MGADIASVRDIGRDAVRCRSVLRIAHGRSALSLVLGLSALAHTQAADRLTAIPATQLCVTEGAVTSSGGTSLSVDVPKMRAYVNHPAADSAQIHFTYLGPTASRSALASGADRLQFGLKLHAQDACNLIYVMWRVEPESKLVVSVKSNPRQHSSSQCGNRGYQNIKPRMSAALAHLGVRQPHTLTAVLRADELRVFVDGGLMWQGGVGSDAVAVKGPAGVRSDNARLEFELAADNPDAALSSQDAGCRSGPEESE